MNPALRLRNKFVSNNRFLGRVKEFISGLTLNWENNKFGLLLYRLYRLLIEYTAHISKINELKSQLLQSKIYLPNLAPSYFLVFLHSLDLLTWKNHSWKSIFIKWKGNSCRRGTFCDHPENHGHRIHKFEDRREKCIEVEVDDTEI